MRSRLPNFLIVGAAKAGTTSVAGYLDQHPQIYMSPIKEPKYISSHFLKFPLKGPGDDFVEAFTIKNHYDYLQLFRWARKNLAVGEASVENLYFYEQAIPVIKRTLGDVKIVVILRNPVDRAFSAYKMMLRDGREELDFEDALEEENERKKKNWEYLWYYQDVGFYHDQVQAYLDNFSQVKIALFDDLRSDGQAFMRDLYRFLGVNDHFRPKIDVKVNSSGFLKNSFYRFVFRATGFKGLLYKYLSLNGVPDNAILSVVEAIRDGELEPVHLKTETREKLQEVYRTDVGKLQTLIGRDLRAWLQ